VNQETPDVQPEEPVWDPDPIARRRRLEAVLFMARQPLSSRKISQLAGLEDGTQARTIIAERNKSYNETGRAFQIKRFAGGYQMLTRPQFSKWLRQMEHIPRARKLSRPAMETLAVVAYRQPVIKADIEAIRGVACGEMLRQLLEIGYVRIYGRSEELGRPFLYSTSREFLEDFGLKNQDDLPRASELIGQGLPNWNNSDQISDQQNLQPTESPRATPEDSL
jgi:segregation and condensation protein B